jgi:hypothetical protein
LEMEGDPRTKTNSTLAGSSRMNTKRVIASIVREFSSKISARL